MKLFILHPSGFILSYPYPPGDVNHDCVFDMLDFALSAQYWLIYTGPE